MYITYISKFIPNTPHAGDAQSLVLNRGGVAELCHFTTEVLGDTPLKTLLLILYKRIFEPTRTRDSGDTRTDVRY